MNKRIKKSPEIPPLVLIRSEMATSAELRKMTIELTDSLKSSKRPVFVCANKEMTIQLIYPRSPKSNRISRK